MKAGRSMDNQYNRWPWWKEVVCMFGLLLIVGVFMVPIAAVNRAYEAEAKNWYEEYQYSTCFIDTAEWTGSGVFIDEDTILTAAHVLDGANDIEIELLDGTDIEVISVQYSDDIDCGIITVEPADVNCVRIGTTDFLEVGDEIVIVGCPLGSDLNYTVTTGIVSGLDRDLYPLGEDLLQSDAQSWPGNSGGGVYGPTGRLIGLLIGGYGGYDGISIIIPIEDCVEYMDEIGVR